MTVRAYPAKSHLPLRGWKRLGFAVAVRLRGYRSIAHFQAHALIRVDGLVGPQTWAAFFDKPITAASLSRLIGNPTQEG